MVRIAGVNLPDNKPVFIGLTYILGIGRTSSLEIVKKADVDGQKRMKELTEQELTKIREILNDDYVIEGDLRREVAMNIKRLREIRSYRGMRHSRGMPVRGQRTHTNARTRKGRRRSVVGKRK
jgi:small subunit ribosomal protein S13